MVARAEVRGLSVAELESVREALAAGRRPRVQFTDSAGGQLAGQIGQVVELTDPAVADEWVVVRFGRDVLPFSPADLRIAPKGVARKEAAPVPEVPVRPEPEFVIDKPVPVPDQERPVSTEASRPVSAEVPAPRKAKAAARPAKPKPQPGLTVTLAYGEDEWTVSAAQGAKVLARPYVIRPAEALRMVALVDVPGVREAVEQIMAAERAEAEQQAERLRAQLAEVEARLADLPDLP